MVLVPQGGNSSREATESPWRPWDGWMWPACPTRRGNYHPALTASSSITAEASVHRCLGATRNLYLSSMRGGHSHSHCWGHCCQWWQQQNTGGSNRVLEHGVCLPLYVKNVTSIWAQSLTHVHVDSYTHTKHSSQHRGGSKMWL